jgi:hypothetical protein
MRTLKCTLGVLSLISVVVNWAWAQTDHYNVDAYANIRADDCSQTATRDNQRFLFTNYRALFEYRKYYHNYTDLIISKPVDEDKEKKYESKVKYQNYDDDDYQTDEKDSPDNDGTVKFVNWQDEVRNKNSPAK